MNHKKVAAIIDTGAPDNIISTKLMICMKLAPDIPYNKKFSIDGTNSTQAVGAYSAISMKFRKLIVQAPDVVLKNKSYDILLGINFLRKWGDN